MSMLYDLIAKQINNLKPPDYYGIKIEIRVVGLPPSWGELTGALGIDTSFLIAAGRLSSGRLELRRRIFSGTNAGFYTQKFSLQCHPAEIWRRRSMTDVISRPQLDRDGDPFDADPRFSALNFPDRS